MKKKYVLVGRIPSKKNSRVNTRSGRSFPSRDFTEWQDNAINEILIQGRVHFDRPIKMKISFRFKDNTRCDLDNRLSSILDMLVKAGVLDDDRWQLVPEIEVYAKLNNEKQTVTEIEMEEV